MLSASDRLRPGALGSDDQQLADSVASQSVANGVDVCIHLASACVPTKRCKSLKFALQPASTGPWAPKLLRRKPILGPVNQ